MYGEKEVLELLRIVIDLQAWIDLHDGLSVVPIVSFTWTTNTCGISIGDRIVYNDQEPPEDGLSVESCKREWIEHCRSLAPFLVEKPVEERMERLNVNMDAPCGVCGVGYCLPSGRCDHCNTVI